MDRGKIAQFDYAQLHVLIDGLSRLDYSGMPVEEKAQKQLLAGLRAELKRRAKAPETFIAVFHDTGRQQTFYRMIRHDGLGELSTKVQIAHKRIEEDAHPDALWHVATLSVDQLEDMLRVVRREQATLETEQEYI